jgi:ferric hydroxamate transport system permease protein
MMAVDNVIMQRARCAWAHPSILVAALAVLALAATLWVLALQLPAARWANLRELVDGSSGDLPSIALRYATLPRLTVALAAGAALGLSGAIFQHVLHNPLAEPTTLGVSAGASVSLSVVSLWYPDLLMHGREWVALTGALTSVGVVMAVSWSRAFSPSSMMLGGLLFTLCAGAFASVLALFFGQSLVSVFIWQSGVLNQNGWAVAQHLLVQLAVVAALVALLSNSLAVLELGDESARSLGVPLRSIRAGALLIATLLSALVVSAIGVIGFVGLAAPALARLAGARTLRQRLVWSPAVGAAVLWLTDEAAQLIGRVFVEIPTGALTALVGAPLLLLLLPLLKDSVLPPLATTSGTSVPRAILTGWCAVAALGLGMLIFVSIDFNRSLSGWQLSTWPELRPLLALRAPRIAGALAAGVMLALAGVVIQRLTANPMASPEILGVSSGASLALIAMLFIAPSAGQVVRVATGSAAAFATLLVMFALARKSTFSPERLVLVGIAIATVTGGVVSVLLTSGDPRIPVLQAWMAGSTYRVQTADAVTVCVVAVLCVCALPFASRALELLSLGEPAAHALGLRVPVARMTLLILCAAATATATLIVGPVSFVGLMGPHMARLLGWRRAVPQALGGAAIGAALMVLADWLGRNLLFPNQVPAGLLVAFIGGPYFLILMWKQKT